MPSSPSAFFDLWPYTAAITAVMVVAIVVVARHQRLGAMKPAAWRYQNELDAVAKMMKNKDLDGAEKLLKVLVAKPDAPWQAYNLHAMVASARGDPKLAIRRYAVMRKRLPTITMGYTGPARLLIRLGRLQEAERMLDGGVGKVDQPVQLTKVRAEAAAAVEDWPAAIRLWEEVRATLPGDSDGYVQGYACLAAAGRMEEARETLKDAAIRMPRHPEILKALEAAGLAADQRPPDPPPT